MTYGYCAYHEIECDYDGQCKKCPHNTQKDIEWFEQDEVQGRNGGNMSKSILIIDTPKGCVFCPLAKMHGFNAFHNYSVKQECVMDRQPYMGITCPFCNGIRYIYNLTDDEVLTYKHKECPLKESEKT